MEKLPHNDNSSIYVVDDNPLHVEFIERMLQRKGYMVKTFSDGLSLLEKLKTEQPHMIISDIDMPEMDGFELHEEVKKMPGIEIPLLYISSLGGQTVKKRAKASGAIGFIQKPIMPGSFLETIAKKL